MGNIILNNLKQLNFKGIYNHYKIKYMDNINFIQLPISKLKYPITQYLDRAITTIDDITELLKSNFDITNGINIWCRGSSGAIMAGLVAANLYKTIKLENNSTIAILHVKKDGESSHNSNYFNSHTNNKLNIIVDDFICTGETIRQIFNCMKNNNTNNIDCICVTGTVETRDLFDNLYDMTINNVICENFKK